MIKCVQAFAKLRHGWTPNAIDKFHDKMARVGKPVVKILVVSNIGDNVYRIVFNADVGDDQ